MYYSKSYAPQYGGNYHNYSMNNKTNTNRVGRVTSSAYPQTSQVVPASSIESLSLAMGYVPWQTWGELYDTHEALHNGTVFKELNLKFCG
jgi:hypothetical protein